MMDSDHEIEFRDPFIDARDMPQSDTQINENMNLPPMAGARPKSARSKENSDAESDQNKMNPEIIALLKSLSTPQNTCKRDFPPFDGSQNFDDYYQQALRIKSINSWDDNVAASHLALALKGPALQLINSIQKAKGGTPLSWVDLTGALLNSFSPIEDQYTLQSVLRQRKQLPSESIQQLNRSIICDVAKAYSSDAEAAQERMSLNIFCEAIIDPDIRLTLLRAQPRTMAEALRCAENERILLQAARRATPTVMSHYDPQQGVPVNLASGNNRPKDKSRPYEKQSNANFQKSHASESSVDNLRESLNNISLRLDQMAKKGNKSHKNTNGSRRFRGTCFNCGGQGHKASVCPSEN